MSTTNKRPDEILLQVQDVHVAYGKAEVVHGVSIDVRKGEFVVLLGRNGAGKSALLHAISGLIPKKSGQVLFDGNDVTHSSPRDIVQNGVIQVLEGHRIFHSLSVEDNLLIGTYANAPKGDRSKLECIYDLFQKWLSANNKWPLGYRVVSSKYWQLRKGSLVNPSY